MFGWLKRLFTRNKKHYVYVIVYYDFINKKSHTSKHVTDKKIERDYPNFWGGYFSSVRILFTFEGDDSSELPKGK